MGLSSFPLTLAHLKLETFLEELAILFDNSLTQTRSKCPIHLFNWISSSDFRNGYTNFSFGHVPFIANAGLV